MAIKTITTSPVVFGGGGGFLVAPLQGTTAVSEVKVVERVLHEEVVNAAFLYNRSTAEGNLARTDGVVVATLGVGFGNTYTAAQVNPHINVQDGATYFADSAAITGANGTVLTITFTGASAVADATAFRVAAIAAGSINVTLLASKTTLANTPIAGTLSVKQVGTRLYGDSSITATGTAATVVGHDEDNSSSDFTVRYRYLDTGNQTTLQTTSATAVSTVFPVEIPKHHEVTFTNTLDGFIVDN